MNRVFVALIATALLAVTAMACGSSSPESTATTAAGPLLDPKALATQLAEDNRPNIEIYEEEANCFEGSGEREFECSVAYTANLTDQDPEAAAASFSGTVVVSPDGMSYRVKSTD